MNPHTLQALKESIAHWERLASGKRKPLEIVDVDNCALCAMFNTPAKDKESKCVGCPVFEKTGERFCMNTPFAAAEKISEDFDNYDDPLDSEEFQEAAALELEFLESLLPKEAK